jgi:cytochrome c oxidase assembly protein subunit 15
MDKHRMIRIIGLMTAFGSYLMLLMGAIVTKTGSGEGCGNSWPFCHGQLIPESLPVETVIEYSHRIVSGGVGFLILLLAVWSWRVYRDSRRVKTLGFMSLFFVVLQGALGAVTVVFRGPFAKKFALALHFGFSLISFASVVLLVVHLFQMKRSVASKRAEAVPAGIHWGVWLLAAYTYVVVYTGALVRHAKATMGCGYEFPTCGTTVFPGFDSIAGIHMLHRYASLLLWALVLVFFIAVLRRARERSDLVTGSRWAFILITLQAASGVTTVLTGGQLLAALLHTTIISVFFSAICYLCMQTGRPWKKGQVAGANGKRAVLN